MKYILVTLRERETNEQLNHFTQGAIKESVRHIVGVQFRNLATIGGSIYGRFGFSDVLTLFMALDCEVELYPTGRVSIKKFANMKFICIFEPMIYAEEHRSKVDK